MIDLTFCLCYNQAKAVTKTQSAARKTLCLQSKPAVIYLDWIHYKNTSGFKVTFLDLLKLEKKVVATVKAAAKLFRRGAVSVTQKDGAANLVTNADIDIQCFLQDRLHRLLLQAGFLCEEENVVDTNKDYVWVIDPIDGTTNFTRDIPECVISVGLLYKKQAVIGVVYAPRLELLFTAVKGNGAYCCGKKIETSDKKFDEALLCTGLCVYQKELSHFCSDIISRMYDLCSDIRRLGSCALELCYLALGRCDLYFEIRTYPWDYAAASLILTEAGGVIKGHNKADLDYENITMLVGANNADNFEKLNGIVADVIKEKPIYRK